MSIATLFTKAKAWKQPSVHQQMNAKKVVYLYSGILFSHKMNALLALEATWMNIEMIILNEVRQRQILYHLYVESEK